jgi:hypothetical protein
VVFGEVEVEVELVGVMIILRRMYVLVIAEVCGLEAAVSQVSEVFEALEA